MADFFGVVTVRLVVEWGEMEAGGIFDELDAFVAFGAAPVVAEEGFAFLRVGGAFEDEDGMVLPLGEDVMEEFIFFEAVEMGETAFMKFGGFFVCGECLEFFLLFEVTLYYQK